MYGWKVLTIVQIIREYEVTINREAYGCSSNNPTLLKGKWTMSFIRKSEIIISYSVNYVHMFFRWLTRKVVILLRQRQADV